MSQESTTLSLNTTLPVDIKSSTKKSKKGTQHEESIGYKTYLKGLESFAAGEKAEDAKDTTKAKEYYLDALVHFEAVSRLDPLKPDFLEKQADTLLKLAEIEDNPTKVRAYSTEVSKLRIETLDLLATKRKEERTTSLSSQNLILLHKYIATNQFEKFIELGNICNLVLSRQTLARFDDALIRSGNTDRDIHIRFTKTINKLRNRPLKSDGKTFPNQLPLSDAQTTLYSTATTDKADQAKAEELAMLKKELKRTGILRNVNRVIEKETGYTMLMVAARGGHTEIVTTLLQNKNINTENALIIAKKNDQIECVRQIAGFNLLHTVKTDSSESIDTFLRDNAANAAVEFADSNNCTALSYAAKNGNLELVKKLLDAKADVNHQDKSGKFPLLYAVENNHASMVKVLLKAGADSNLQMFKAPYETALTYANYHSRSIKIIELLLAEEPRKNLMISRALDKHSIKVDFDIYPFHAPGIYKLFMYIQKGGRLDDSRINELQAIEFGWVTIKYALSKLAKCDSENTEEISNRRTTLNTLITHALKSQKMGGVKEKDALLTIQVDLALESDLPACAQKLINKIFVTPSSTQTSTYNNADAKKSLTSSHTKNEPSDEESGSDSEIMYDPREHTLKPFMKFNFQEYPGAIETDTESFHIDFEHMQREWPYISNNCLFPASRDEDHSSSSTTSASKPSSETSLAGSSTTPAPKT